MRDSSPVILQVRAVLMLLSCYLITRLESVHGTFTARVINEKNSKVFGTQVFDDDLKLTSRAAETSLFLARSRPKRKINADERSIWPLPIPYRFNQSSQFLLNSTERSSVMAAIREFSSLTCITFQEVNSTYLGRPVLDFRKDSGCWSYVGRDKSRQLQEISTASGCFQKGILLHELGHAIGFRHEQSRPDRDEYVTVLEENVKRGEEFNFQKATWGDIDNMGVPYDVGSIMHYGSHYFSKNGQKTLETKDPRLQRNLGQRQALSFFDVKLANLAYCRGSCPLATISCLHDGYPDPKNCSRCRCPDGLRGSRCELSAEPVGTNCGERLYVERDRTYSIKSPGFPQAYAASTQCYWLLQTRHGMRVHLEINSDNFMTHPDCPSSKEAPCVDYVEIKYNLSFGFTGAKFCCGLPPANVIVSSGNKMLVLFRTSRHGVGGFTAEVYSEPCGGCYKTEDSQRPCQMQQKMMYRQEWYQMEYVPCPILYRSPTYVCNTFLPRKYSRESFRVAETEHCCTCYGVKHGYCIPAENPDTFSHSPVGGTDNNSFLSSSESNEIVDQRTETLSKGWSKWSTWSVCTATCGGCGMRVRSRTCVGTPLCRGQSSKSQSQECNTQPCRNYQTYACDRKTVEQYNCGWLYNCTRNKMEMRTCVTRCCPNYEEKNGVCHPVIDSRGRRRRQI